MREWMAALTGVLPFASLGMAGRLDQKDASACISASLSWAAMAFIKSFLRSLL